MTHTEMGSCKPPVSTSPPDSKYTAMWGYFIMGHVAPGSDSFSGSMMMPSEHKGMCMWTWNFSRK
jgi:hypothetical protein